MASETDIANWALAHLGQGLTIADLTEASTEARACAQFFEPARDEMLAEFDWPFATVIDELTLVEEDPNEDWEYSYRYPTDCLKLRRILSGARMDSQSSAIPYKIAQDSSGMLVFTDQEDAQVEYTIRKDAIGLWPIKPCLALSYRLAMYITPRIIQDERKLSSVLERMYMMSVSSARAAAANEEQMPPMPPPEMIAGR